MPDTSIPPFLLPEGTKVFPRRPPAAQEPGASAEALGWLREAIRRSGLTHSAFARRVVVRDPRTVRRWLSGRQMIPESVLRRLRALLRLPSRCHKRRSSAGYR